MTGLGAERTPCAAYPAPSVPPTGVCSPVPPHIQGAEWRTESRARRTGIRWSLRVLVVGGLAGAAWLLTGAAAHAADRVDGPDGSLLGSVVGADATSPVTGLLQAAVQPLEVRTDHHERHVVADVLDVPRRVLTRPAETIDEVTKGTSVDAVLDSVDQVSDEATGAHRPAGGPVDEQRLSAVTDTVTPVVSTDAERPSRPADEQAQQPVAEPAGAPASSSAPAVATSRAPIKKVPQSTAGGPRAAAPGKHRKVTSAPSAHRHHHHAVRAAKVAAPETAQGDSTPGGDGPAAPLRLHLGDVSGTPATGPGAPTEGGSAAFLPAAIANSTMAPHRPSIASDVEVRRHDAEAPTVSPD